MVRTIILKPMAVVMRYLFKRPITVPYRGSNEQRDRFYRKQRDLQMIEKPHYAIGFKHTPHISPRSRGTLALNIENCTGCSACYHICPNKCIQMTEIDPQPPDWKKSKPKRCPEVFLARCMHCGFCTVAEACRFDALHHTPFFDSAETTIEAQFYSYNRLNENWKRWQQVKAKSLQTRSNEDDKLRGEIKENGR